MERIGGNEFYTDLAELEAEGYAPKGSQIRQTERGFLLLRPNEGLTMESAFAWGTPIIATKQDEHWEYDPAFEAQTRN